MNGFYDEAQIITNLQDVDTSSVLLINDLEDEEDIFQSIYDSKSWKEWIDSSGRGDPPPDYYCDSQKLMLEVMRVDDHAFLSKKGKIVNPYKTKETEIFQELKDKGFLNIGAGKDLQVIINAVTELPTEEDHNYSFYLNNFRRVIESHKKKIRQYKKNHPGYKMIFLVFDESSTYLETDQPRPKIVLKGQAIYGKRHFHFWDSAFLKTFIQSEIDYLIWYTPYKFMETASGEIITEPRVCVFNTRYPVFHAIPYIEANMVSYEV